MDYFSYDISASCARSSASSSTPSGRRAQRGEPLTDRHRDMAFALQAVTEEIVLHRVRTLLKQHPQRDLCLSGGVALNCVANAKILEHTDVRRLWVPPCASDTGAPLGSALVALPPRPRAPPRLRAEARPPRQGLRRGGDRARPRVAGLRYRRMGEAQLHCARGAGPGGRQDRRLVPGPVRDGAACARQPLDPGRSAPSRHARRAQRQGQAARAVPPLRAGRAGRAGGRVLRDRPARSVHDAGAARARRRAATASRPPSTSTARGASRRSSACRTRATTV